MRSYSESITSMWLRRCSAAILLTVVVAVPSYAQRKKRSEKNAIEGLIIIHGTVIAHHTSVPVSGISYTSPPLGKSADTAISDSDGHFTLELETSKPRDTKGDVRLRIRQLSKDTMVFSASERVLVNTDSTVAEIKIDRYPTATLSDGTPLVGSFTLPRFSGQKSQNDLNSFLSTQLRYPDDAREGGIQGTVVARFMIDETGAVLQLEIIRSADSGLDKEVVRVINAMPAWRPGQVDGKSVSMQYYLPVHFELD